MNTYTLEFLKSLKDKEIGLPLDTVFVLEKLNNECTFRQEKIKQLEQELQKAREQLNKCELALNNYAICDDVGSIARRYFKDKQGESK